MMRIHVLYIHETGMRLLPLGGPLSLTIRESDPCATSLAPVDFRVNSTMAQAPLDYPTSLGVQPSPTPPSLCWYFRLEHIETPPYAALLFPWDWGPYLILITRSSWSIRRLCRWPSLLLRVKCKQSLSLVFVRLGTWLWMRHLDSVQHIWISSWEIWSQSGQW